MLEKNPADVAALSALPPVALEALRRGRLNLRQARLLARLPDKAEQAEYAALRHLESDALERQLALLGRLGRRGVALDEVVDADRGGGDVDCFQ